MPSSMEGSTGFLAAKLSVPCQHDAIGHNQWYKNAQHQIQRMNKGIHRHVDYRYQRGDDQNEYRDADFMGYQVADGGD